MSGADRERPLPVLRQAEVPRQLVAIGVHAGGSVAVAEVRAPDVTDSHDDHEAHPSRRDESGAGGQPGPAQETVTGSPSPASSDTDLLKAKLSAPGGSRAGREAEELKAKLTRSGSAALKSKPAHGRDEEQRESAEADDADAALTRAAADGARPHAADDSHREFDRDQNAEMEPDRAEASAGTSGNDDADEDLTRAAAEAARRHASEPGRDERPAEPVGDDDVNASGGSTGERPRLRPVPSSRPAGDASGRLPGPAARLAADFCEIKLWRGYTKAHFFAAVGGEAGDEGIVAASPLFRCWLTSEVSEERADAQAALSVLLDRLEDESWVRVGKGEEWFSTVLRRGSPRG
jgi:hypothetical protein